MPDRMRGWQPYQVVCQVSGMTPDGWESSRQVPTMNIWAATPVEAARAVSDLVWAMTPSSYVNRNRVTRADVMHLPTAEIRRWKISYVDGGIISEPWEYVFVDGEDSPFFE